jgi:hypothetical protein
MERLICISQQLSGSYGTVVAGQVFETDGETAFSLKKAGYARSAVPPPILYETKVIRPQDAPQVSTRQPFRHGDLRHEESQGVASQGDRVLPKSDLP